jgi:L-rhamnose-H+ transport protein
MDPATATNPMLGVAIFTLGGLAGAVFYLPFKKVKQWAWESYWLVYAVVGLVVVPWALALSTSPNALAVLAQSPVKTLVYCCACGAMWGFGGLTWGLMIRYLGVGLGLAIGCGLCSATGTLIPPILKGDIAALTATPSAVASLIGVGVSLVGIVLVGMAGMSKESELPEEAKKKAVAEYNFKKGILIALFSGIMSAGMSFGLQGGAITEFKAEYGSQTRIIKADEASMPAELAGAAGVFFHKDSRMWVAPAGADGEKTTAKSWRGMPILVVVLFGGFLVNFIWCLMLNVRNKTGGDYMKAGAPILANILFAGAAGAIWCSQFICFKTGEPAMGDKGYIGWAVLMASAILFSTLLGIFLGEWKGTSGRTRGLLTGGLVLLVLTAVITGYSGKLAQAAPAPAAPAAETAPAAAPAP